MVRKTNFGIQPGQRLKQIRHFVMDLDGTVYNGHTLFPFIKQLLGDLKKKHIDYTFLTNNSSQSAEAYVRKLRSMGLPVKRSQVYTSTQATIDFLRRHHPKLKRLYLIGTKSLKREFILGGFTVVDDDRSLEPQAVIVGFDTTLTYRKLCRASYWIKAGKLFIATHPDLICPTDQETLLVDCGSLCAALEAATGRKPDAVPGKPNPAMINNIMQRHGLERYEVAMVGDRLYTDMEMARQVGIMSILVLSGETTPSDLKRSTFLPDLVLENVGELSKMLIQNRQ
ncbi:MAG: HAD-IIA family hydrolase [Candidatus Marinimicrobia bacterium]|nr:HAD-IIA family hydrolase [Candidatus Neomarinimicrobiota bacterium]